MLQSSQLEDSIDLVMSLNTGAADHTLILPSFIDEGLLIGVTTKLGELINGLLVKALEPPLVSLNRSLVVLRWWILIWKMLLDGSLFLFRLGTWSDRTSWARPFLDSASTWVDVRRRVSLDFLLDLNLLWRRLSSLGLLFLSRPLPVSSKLCLKLIVEFVELLGLLEAYDHLWLHRVISPGEVESLDGRDHSIADPVHEQLHDPHGSENLLLTDRVKLHMLKLASSQDLLCQENIQLVALVPDQDNVLSSCC
jgi:hypothetical protein